MDTSKKQLRFKQFLPGIAWFLFLLVLICLPGEDVPEQPNWLPDFDKFVHAALFGGLVFWFCLPFKKSDLDKTERQQLFIKITLAAVVWGITTEFIQRFFIEGRQFDLVDWAADSLGAIISFFICRKLFL